MSFLLLHYHSELIYHTAFHSSFSSHTKQFSLLGTLPPHGLYTSHSLSLQILPGFYSHLLSVIAQIPFVSKAFPAYPI